MLSYDEWTGVLAGAHFREDLMVLTGIQLGACHHNIAVAGSDKDGNDL